MDCKDWGKKKEKFGKGAKCKEKVKQKKSAGKEENCKICVKRQRSFGKEDFYENEVKRQQNSGKAELCKDEVKRQRSFGKAASKRGTAVVAEPQGNPRAYASKQPASACEQVVPEGKTDGNRRQKKW